MKDVHTIYQYRPINLCNSIYKLITKIIANRIKPIISKIIGQTQTNFQQCKRASDNAIIVQETLTYFQKKKGKISNMLLKLDLEKTFDRLEWSFFEKTLLFFNFSTSLIKLIMSCITTSSTSILINDTRTFYFYPSRGILLGDPLSPYLFIMCMKILLRTISLSVDYLNWQPIRLYKSGAALSHIFFAGDLILLAKVSTKSFHTIILITLSNTRGTKLTFRNQRSFFLKIAPKQARILFLALSKC